MSSAKPNYQSLRSSCDRCRFFKLKCITPPGSDSSDSKQDCARCIRAKAECIYSRRARSKRHSNASRRQATAEPEEQAARDQDSADTGTVLPASTTDRSKSIDDSCSITRSNSGSSSHVGIETQMQPPQEDMSDVASILFTQDTSLPSDMGAASIPSSTGFMPQASGFPGPDPGAVGGPMDLDLALLSGTTAWSYLLGTDDAHVKVPSSNSDLDTLTEASSNSNENTSSIAMRLSSLIMEIHHTATILHDYTWWSLEDTTASAHGSGSDAFNFNDYPVGDVLHLCQEFSDVIRSLSSRGQGHAPPAADDTFWHEFPSLPLPLPDGVSSSNCIQAAAPAQPVDAMLLLLTLSCHMSLARLYEMVLGHFESRLSSIQKTSTSGLPMAPQSLQLGQLPHMDDGISSKTHTAVRILLDAFRCLESVIGLPASFRVFPLAPSLSPQAESASLLSACHERQLEELFENSSLGTGKMNGAQDDINRLHMRIESVKQVFRRYVEL